MGATLLVLANKQDVPNAMTSQEIADFLELDKVKSYHWKIYPCSAVTGANVKEAFDWLIDDICNRIFID